jgi:pimeloyl-ACP methyl ester carboxylesterase
VLLAFRETVSTSLILTSWATGKIVAPVLLLSGERDPVTPPEMAEQAACVQAIVLAKADT